MSIDSGVVVEGVTLSVTEDKKRAVKHRKTIKGEPYGQMQPIVTVNEG